MLTAANALDLRGLGRGAFSSEYLLSKPGVVFRDFICLESLVETDNSLSDEKVARLVKIGDNDW